MKPNPKWYLGLYTLLLLAAFPLIFQWVPPNRWYGVRVPGLMLETQRWYEINALSGKLFGSAMIVCFIVNLMLQWFAPAPMIRYIHWINGALILLSFWSVTLQVIQAMS